MEQIDKTIKFLAQLGIEEDAILELYTRMNTSKQRINEVLGLNEGNNFRRIITFNMTEEIFKTTYPETYKYIGMLAKGNKFSVIDNWIKDPKKRKLSQFLSSVGGTPHNIEIKLYNEIRNGDISVIFDIIKPKEIVISTNMYDFFTSASNAAFRSCYAIDGSHFNGNIAYMTDKYTFMIYTYSKNINRKIGRVWGYYLDDEMFLTSKVYGSMYEAEIGMAIHSISNTINPDAKWKANGIDYDRYSNARPGMDYPIPVYFDYDAIILHHTMGTIKCSNLPYLDFSLIKCMKCGITTTNGYYGMCETCGSEISRCNHCNKVFHYSNLMPDHDVCKECYDELYKPCNICGRKYIDYHMINIDGKNICMNCITLTHSKCKLCHEYHFIEELVEIGSYKFCQECKGRIYECDLCGSIEIMSSINDVPKEHEGNKYCNNCYKEVESNSNIITKSWEYFRHEYYGILHVTINHDEGIMNIRFSSDVCSEEQFLFMKDVPFEEIRSNFTYIDLNNIGNSYVELATYFINNEINRCESEMNIPLGTIMEQPLTATPHNERRRGRFHIPNVEQPSEVLMEQHDEGNISFTTNHITFQNDFEIGTVATQGLMTGDDIVTTRINGTMVNGYWTNVTRN